MSSSIPISPKPEPNPTTTAAGMSSLIPISPKPELNPIPLTEPLPYIDYDLVDTLVDLLDTQLGKKELDGHTSLTRARKAWYMAYQKLQRDCNGYEDVKAYGIILKKKLKDLEPQSQDQDSEAKDDTKDVDLLLLLPRSEIKARQDTELEWARNAVKRNERDIEASLKKVRNRTLDRQRLTFEFSWAKHSFMRDVMPVLMKASDGVHGLDLSM